MTGRKQNIGMKKCESVEIVQKYDKLSARVREMDAEIFCGGDDRWGLGEGVINA